MEQLGRDEQEIVDAYRRASEAQPSRAEALHGASRFLRLKGRNREALELARAGLAVPEPSGGLFVEVWIYRYGLLDEVSVNAWWAGHYAESLDAAIALLASKHAPAEERERYAATARFALGRLPRPAGGLLAGPDDFVAQHAPGTPRRLRSILPSPPRVLVAILAKQKAEFLSLYLECIEALDYPKTSIALHIRTNNNTDATEAVLQDWVARVGRNYASVEFDARDVPERVEAFAAHEWNPERFRVLAAIRNASLQRALELDCDFYFVADADNFVRPCTLRELVALNLPIVAPFLRGIDPGQYYSNFHAAVDENGYWRDCDAYHLILKRKMLGVFEVPLVHCTYLIRSDVIAELNYEDGSGRFEYVVFSDLARRAGVQQYVDNRQVYGYVAFGEGSVLYVAHGADKARALLAPELADAAAAHSPAVPARTIITTRQGRPR